MITDVETELRKMAEMLTGTHESKVCGLAADIVANACRYQSELQNIANASPKRWEMPLDEFRENFQHWAQSRAHHALRPEMGS